MIHPVVPGCGELDSTLVVLGERPGVNEMRAKEPFVGKTGDVVREAVGGWARVRRTNVRCFFDEHESPSRKGRSYEECRVHLQAEFDTLTAARTILCLGADAARLIVGRDDVTRLHGSTFTRREADAMRATVPSFTFRLPPSITSVVISFHPAYAMRGMPQQMPWIRKAIGDARRLSNETSFARAEFELLLEPTLDEAAAYIRRSKSPLSIDIETPREAATKIQLVGISDGAYSACVFPWGDGYADLMREVLQDTARLKFGHNFAYDLRAFMANGIDPWNPVCDTIQAEALLCPPFKEAKKRRWLALSTAIARRVDGWPYHKEPENPATRALFGAWFPKVPEWLHYRLYCALDSAGTWLLWEAQKTALLAGGMF